MGLDGSWRQRYLAEVAAYIEAHADQVDENGHRLGRLTSH